MKIYFHYSREGFSNGYLIGNEKTGEAVIIDPGSTTTELLNHIEKNKFTISAVLVTHSHGSHHRGLPTLMRIYSPKIYAADAELDGQKTHLLQGDGSFLAAGFTIRYYAVPGHSPDSLMFHIDHVIFTGDALAAGSIGSTNNMYGRKNLLKHLTTKLLSQNDSTILMPGHGPPSSVRAERFFNTSLMQGVLDTEDEGDGI